ncbi:aldehyde dehydrogenase family protein [Petroclostridium sp. X23]|uniref:aldehyde dehydrogenase family protein n=1 Tax=Petroclostridium sp. X23 TaxID=3045146 RepID=UPI0024ADE3B8|nr:aldehyde dehydrogenase family protein [Petroclostridium sp. X23]WHH59032.1 aldehyde dehydrogenase family protein [Petroclostridium sp. X23]
MNSELSAKEYVAGLVERARKAQEIAEDYTQERVDELIKAIAWEVVKEENAHKVATLAVEESRLGNYEGKYAKIKKKIRGALRDMKDEKSVGVIERDEKKGLIKIAKPVGVIGALVPCTNPEGTPVAKAMCAIKGRNAIVFSPHPRTKKTNKMVVDLMREALKKHGAPEDLIITVEEPTIEISNEVMKQCDLIVATGGTPMVKAAYSSGTPAYGVGTGNAVVIVDETADIKDAANKIMLSKTFDYATSCSAENSLLIQQDIYDSFIEALKQEGGYLVNKEEKERLQAALWVDGHLNPKIIAQPAQVIGEAAGMKLSDDIKFIMVEEQGIGKEYPFSGEKLSVVVTLYKYNAFEEAIEKVNTITSYQGKGHSCGIHSNNEEHILELGLKTKVSRIMVRQPQCYGNTGDWVNGMPFTMTLGCGTWGGNITSENIAWKHFINTTWVASPIEAIIPTDEELFGDIMKD